MQKRFADFISRRSRGLDDLIKTTEIFRSRGWTAFAFGGTPRGVYDNGMRYKPRDLDLVFDDNDFNFFQSAFSKYILRRNSFGGLKVQINDLIIDAWPLSATWAFRHGYIANPSFENLPSTTFLNVDGIIIELIPKKSKKRRCFENGFFSGWKEKTLDINLTENPYPSICVIRTLHIARNFGFRISRTLAIYLYDMMSRIASSILIKAQLKHYGKIEFEIKDLHGFQWILENFLANDTAPSIALFPLRPEQIDLIDFGKLIEKYGPMDLLENRKFDAQSFSDKQEALYMENLFKDTSDLLRNVEIRNIAKFKNRKRSQP